MKAKRVLYLILACLFLTPSISCSVDPNAGKAVPNILWIVNEDMSPELGCYGNALVKTPNIDRLASEGAMFTRAYAPSPVCSSSRSSLFTGMYNIRIGAHQHRTPNKKPLPEKVKPVTERLANHGYYICNLSGMFKDIQGNSKTDFNFKVEHVFPGSDWNSCPKGRPFFAYVNFNEPKPYLWDESERWAKENGALIDSSKVELPPYYPGTPKTKKWMAQCLQGISHMDSKVGRVIEQLKKDGFYDNTVIVYFSDHGSAMVRHKQWLYETGTKVPLVIRYPEKIKPGTVSDDLVSLIDITASTLKLAGIEIPEELDGSAIPMLGGKKKEYIFTSRDRCDGTEERIRAVTGKRFKLIRNYRNDVGYVQKNSYYIEARLRPMPELRRLQREGQLNEIQSQWFSSTKEYEEFYDLENDPFETDNLINSGKYQKQIETLRNALDNWIAETDDKGKIKEDPEIAQRSKAKMREQYWHLIDPEVRKDMD
ncbi:MAG: sulfatase [Cytophagales bacterium]|nr:sulfatase [Cytophagales bacterium]